MPTVAEMTGARVAMVPVETLVDAFEALRRVERFLKADRRELLQGCCLIHNGKPRMETLDPFARPAVRRYDRALRQVRAAIDKIAAVR